MLPFFNEKYWIFGYITVNYGGIHMFRIGICDDDLEFIKEIQALCHAYFNEKNVEYEIVLFTKGSDVTSYKNEQIHLLFLDIELPDMNGIEMLGSLCENSMVWRIVYTTNHKELVGGAFSVKTIGFVDKPVYRERIWHYIKVVLKEWQENALIFFDDNDKSRALRVEDILFLKGASNYIEVYCKMDQYAILVYGTVKEWEKKLQNYSFVRVHKSYLVNMFHIEKLSDSVVIRNQGTLPIGRTYRESAKTSFENYCIEQMRTRL